MIFVVSTKVGQGKGGISTGLVGYKLKQQYFDEPVEFVSSHGDGRLGGISASIFVVKNARKQDIVWLHCGNWFSILRKAWIGLVAKCRGVKVVVHFHAVTLDTYLTHKFGRILIHLLCKFADGVVVLTPWWKRRLVESLPELSTPIHVAPNPLDEPLVNAASLQRKTPPGEVVRLLAMSRLIDGKGFQSAIKTLAKLPQQYSLTIAGEGPLMPELKKLCEHLKVEDRVSFTGWVPYEEKAEIFLEHDIFLLPSQNDSFGMGFVEAMAFGLPVVAVDFKATADVVDDERCGYLVQHDDPEQLSKAVVKCTQHYSSLSQYAQKHVLKAFSSEHLIDGLNRFFAEVRNR